MVDRCEALCREYCPSGFFAGASGVLAWDPPCWRSWFPESVMVVFHST